MSTQAKKLALIDPDLLIDLLSMNKSNPLPPANPTLKYMNRLDNKLMTVLNDKESNPNANVNKINAILTKYDTHKDDYQNVPIEKSKIIEEKQIMEDDKRPVDEDHWMINTVSLLPKNLKEKGQMLLNHMNKNNISWDSQGRVIINSEVLEGSNILDIAHGLLRKRKTVKEVPMLNRVYRILRKNNTPLELLPNRANLLEDINNLGDDKEVSPHSSPPRKRRRATRRTTWKTL